MTHDVKSTGPDPESLRIDLSSEIAVKKVQLSTPAASHRGNRLSAITPTKDYT